MRSFVLLKWVRNLHAEISFVADYINLI